MSARPYVGCGSLLAVKIASVCCLLALIVACEGPAAPSQVLDASASETKAAPAKAADVATATTTATPSPTSTATRTASPTPTSAPTATPTPTANISFSIVGGAPCTLPSNPDRSVDVVFVANSLDLELDVTAQLSDISDQLTATIPLGVFVGSAPYKANVKWERKPVFLRLTAVIDGRSFTSDRCTVLDY